MTVLMLPEMVASAFGDRPAVSTDGRSLTHRQLYERAGDGAAVLRRRGVAHLAYMGTSTETLPVALFPAAWAGIPLLPLN